MTPAISALEAADVRFTLHEYEHSGARRDFGAEAADRLGLDPEQVFKTLIVAATGAHAVAIVPVSGSVSLKAMAAAIGAKRIEMCDPGVAQRLTGYVRGGISPFGQRTKLATVLDEHALQFDEIYVSGGRRGLDVGVAPADLVDVLGALVAPIRA